MKLHFLSLLPLAAVPTLASWSKNINYRSPSEHHPSLGISIHRVVKRNDPSSSYDALSLNFTHGVASGDPYPTSVIIWTRIAPNSDNSNSNVTVSGYAPLFDHDNEKYVTVSKSPICVEYKVASDEDLTQVVDSGTVYTSSDVDYTVKVRSFVLHDIGDWADGYRSKRRTWKLTARTTTNSMFVAPKTEAPSDALKPRHTQTTILQQ